MAKTGEYKYILVITSVRLRCTAINNVCCNIYNLKKLEAGNTIASATLGTRRTRMRNSPVTHISDTQYRNAWSPNMVVREHRLNPIDTEDPENKG